jgi:hypothetical protein
MGQDGFRWPKGRICEGHPVRVEALDDLVWEATKRLIEQPKVVFDEYTHRLNRRSQTKTTIESMIAKKKKEARRLEQEKERLLDLYQGGSITKNEIEFRIERLRARIKKSEDEQALILRNMDQNSSQLRLIDQFDTFKNKIASRLNELSFEERKQVVRLLVTEVIADTKKDELVIKHTIPAEKSSLLCLGRNDGALINTHFWV